MRAPVILMLVVTIGLSGACVRKQEKPKTELPLAQPARTTKPVPLAEYDLAGQKRAKPRPTMGALEADTQTPRKKSGRTSPTETSE